VQRTLQDYLLILRERIWYIVWCSVVFSSSLVYTLSQTKITSPPRRCRFSAATRRHAGSAGGRKRHSFAEDLNTQIKILESGTIVSRVAERITGDDLRDFLAPYARPPRYRVCRQRAVQQSQDHPAARTLVVNVAYQHSDRFVAAKVAISSSKNIFTHNTRLRIDDSANAVHDLKGR